jgi:hypothetical protein
MDFMIMARSPQWILGKKRHGAGLYQEKPGFQQYMRGKGLCWPVALNKTLPSRVRLC